MSSVNKKYHNLFEIIMKEKYPLLMNFKKEDEFWKQFYVKMTYYIAKLKTKYNFPYIPYRRFNPENFYLNKKYVWISGLKHAAGSGSNHLITYILKTSNNIFTDRDFNRAMAEAVQEGHADIVNRIIKILTGL